MLSLPMKPHVPFSQETIWAALDSYRPRREKVMVVDVGGLCVWTEKLKIENIKYVVSF